MENSKSGFNKAERNNVNFLRLCFPFAYFQFTRLNSVQSLVFHSWYEWLAGVFVLTVSTELNLFSSFFAYLEAYLPFIALYEIGYIVNDFYSSKNEEKARYRLSIYGEVKEWEVLVWILIRAFFVLFFIYFTDIGTLRWIFFAGFLIIVFSIHNYFKIKELKFITFMNLALSRFMLPLIPFLHIKQIQLLIPVVLLNYVLYRTINYLDSKELLMMENRKEPWFKLFFYLLLIPFNLLLQVTFENPLPVYLNIFYLMFWTIYFTVSRIRAF